MNLYDPDWAHRIVLYGHDVSVAHRQEWLTYEDQIPPDLLARVEAMREEERAEWLKEHELPSDEETEEWPTGLGGRPSPEVGDSFAVPRNARTGLPAHGRLERWTWHVTGRGKTGYPRGRSTTWRDGMPKDVLRDLRYAMGCSQVRFNRLVKNRRKKSSEERQEREELALRFAHALAVNDGLGMVRHLADAYKCSESTVVRLAKEGRVLVG